MQSRLSPQDAQARGDWRSVGPEAKRLQAIGALTCLHLAEQSQGDVARNRSSAAVAVGIPGRATATASWQQQEGDERLPCRSLTSQPQTCMHAASEPQSP